MRRKCASPISQDDRDIRAESTRISHSTCPFCHGVRAAIGRSRMCLSSEQDVRSRIKMTRRFLSWIRSFCHFAPLEELTRPPATPSFEKEINATRWPSDLPVACSHQSESALLGAKPLQDLVEFGDDFSAIHLDRSLRPPIIDIARRVNSLYAVPPWEKKDLGY